MCSYDYYSRVGVCPETGPYTDPCPKGCQSSARFGNAKPEYTARHAATLSDGSAGHSTTATANTTRESKCPNNPAYAAFSDAFS